MYSIVLESGDYEEMHKNTLEIFSDLDASELAQKLEQVFVLAELLGRWAVVEDA